MKELLKGLLDRSSKDAEVREEMQSHLEMREELNRENGLSPEEACADARRRFGNRVRLQEDIRALHVNQFLETIWKDVSYGLKRLRSRRGFSALAIATLAIGIGSAAAMLTVVDGVLVRPLNHRDSERLVTVWSVVAALQENAVMGNVWNQFTLSYQDYEEWLRHQTVIEETAVFSTGRTRFIGEDETRMLDTGSASPNFFYLLGTPFFRGRPFTTDEPDAIVVTYEWWNTSLGGDPYAIGRKISLDAQQRTIVGILPKGFNFSGYGLNKSLNPQIWEPIQVVNPVAPNYEVIGLLRPGAAFEEAQQETDRIFQGLRFAFLEDVNWSTGVMAPGWNAGGVSRRLP